MKINKIILENYRIHKKREFEFGKGINLVLGRNGAGKSSILEAIGVVLFGADARTSDKDAIMIGEKTAFISIEIMGKDGIEYIIEKKFGSSNDYRLYPKSNKLPIIQGKDGVLAKIREISGIEKNSKEIYQNVVTAYQNKIVGIFSDTPKNRETLFNKIFDTAIYKEMESGYLKSAKDEYEFQKKLLSKEIEQRRDVVEDISVLKTELIKYEEVYERVNKEYMQKKEEIALIEFEKEKLIAAKNKIELLNKELIGNENLIIENKVMLENHELELQKAENAAKICSDAEKDYNLYIELEKKEKLLNEIILKKEDVKNKLEIAKNKRQEAEKNREKYNVIISERKKSKFELEEKIKELEIKKRNLVEENSRYLGNKREYDLKTSNLEKKITLLKSYIIKIDEIEKQLYNIESGKKFLLEKIENIEEIKAQQREYLEKIEFYEKKKREKKEFEKSIESSKIKMAELKKAEVKLTGGQCPFLHEKCKNIIDESGFNLYFKNRETELNSEIEKLIKKIEEYKGIELELESLMKKEAVLKKEISDSEIYSEKIKRAEAEQELYLMKKIDIMKIVSKEFKEINSKEEISNLAESIESEKAELRGEIERVQAGINENSKKQLEIESEIREVKAKLEKESIEQEKYSQELLKSEDIIIKADKYIESKSEEISGLEENKSEAVEIQAEKERASLNYKIYMSNIKLAGEIAKIKENMEKIKNKINEIQVKITKTAEEIKVESKNFNQELLDKKIQILYNLREEYEVLARENSRKEIEIKQLKDRIEKSRCESDIILKKEEELQNILKKIELTDMFRKNIGSMGRAVSAELISIVEREATENFKRITGRDEEIKWINGEKEIYSIYLFSKEGVKRVFDILSGGEQVAVALSIRAAMASTLTTAGFAIFDEPTINLDMERKRYLSESLQEILKGLEQAIIVTHDDTFEEMAERIIEV